MRRPNLSHLHRPWHAPAIARSLLKLSCLAGALLASAGAQAETGSLATVASVPSIGSAGESNRATRSPQPNRVAKDSSGWFYVSETGNDTIRIKTLDAGLRAHDGSAVVRLACEPPDSLSSPVRFTKNGASYGILLVETNSPEASKFRIQTSSGVKAFKKLP